MNTQRKKFKIVLIYQLIKNGIKWEWIPQFVGFTERLPKEYLNTFVMQANANAVNISQKLQNLPPLKTNELKIEVISFCYEDELAQKLAEKIAKYDTSNNGWNTNDRMGG